MTDTVSASMKIAGAKAAEGFGVILSFEQTAAIYRAMLAASPQEEGSSAEADTHRAAEGAVVASVSLEGCQGEPAGMMTVTLHMSDGTKVPIIRDNGNVIDHWARVDAAIQQATPPAEPEWIKHDGGPNPVPGKMVSVRFRGSPHTDYDAGRSDPWEWPTTKAPATSSPTASPKG